MKAIIQDRYGSPDVLDLREIARPIPAHDEVLVRVRAASVNAYDWHLLSGKPYLVRLVKGVRKPRKPLIVGGDMAGVVEAVGKDVTRFRVGDEVYGVTGFGGFAEYSAFPEKRLATKPKGLTFEQAAAVPMAALTALEGLRGVGRIQAGQRVLINGASGGVGTFAVQIAKALGAEVTGVCSTGKLDLVRSVGADHVIDYTKQDFAKGGERYDLILDMDGSRSLRSLRRALTPKGTLAIGGGNGGKFLGPVGLLLRASIVSMFVRQRLAGVFDIAKPEGLDYLRPYLESGTVTPIIERTYPLAQAPDAIHHVHQGLARGKVVVTI